MKTPANPPNEITPGKLVNVAKAKGRWTAIYVCNECGEKRRTVLGIAEHILEKHDDNQESLEGDGDSSRA
jgi:hypothetical protein